MYMPPFSQKGSGQLTIEDNIMYNSVGIQMVDISSSKVCI